MDRNFRPLSPYNLHHQVSNCSSRLEAILLCGPKSCYLMKINKKAAEHETLPLVWERKKNKKEMVVVGKQECQFRKENQRYCADNIAFIVAPGKITAVPNNHLDMIVTKFQTSA